MNREKNGYTIIYASVMVIIVAFALSFTHLSLSDKQIANVNIDKMQQILRSLNIEASTQEAEAKYAELIQDAFLIDNNNGEMVEGSEGTDPEDPAFSTPAGGGKEGLPLFKANIDGEVKYVLPMKGAGLWGEIWGYLAVDEDGSTIFGVDFGHASETPGLGAEIVHDKFRNQFNGKHLFRDNRFTSVAVVKVGQTDSQRDYVDGISGGTITSRGVDNMLLNSIGKYEKFLTRLTVTE